MASALDSYHQLALMMSAGTGDAPGNDLGPLTQIAAKPGHIFVIDMIDAVNTEGTYLLAASAAATAAIGSFRPLRSFSHSSKPPLA